MIEFIIGASLSARKWVLIAAAAVAVFTAYTAVRLKLDALPDISDTQVIIKVDFPGQPPQLVEDETTYPLTAQLLGVSGIATVRAVSMFGEAYIYVVLADGTNSDSARSRIFERAASLKSQLPAGASVALGADASGTGWIYQYALEAKGGAVPTDRLYALQQFLLKPELQSVPGVAEVATFGGAARQVQVEVDPNKLLALGLTPDRIAAGVRDANAAAGGSALDLGGQRFVVSADERLHSARDLLDTPVGRDANGAVVRLHQLARVSFGPVPTQGAGDLNGAGNTVGGIIVMHQGENAELTLRRVKEKIAELQTSLPPGVALVTTYDRSTLIHRAVISLLERLAEEAAIVALVCGVFLWHARSSLVILTTLPIGLLVALAILEWQGITANIMSLGGLAIAIGAMTDAAIVMVEAVHRKLEHPGNAARSHSELVLESTREVGPALFFSLLVITVAFLPVFSLEGAEGKLFAPLALTKTYAMATAAAASVTLVPVLIELLIRPPVFREQRNPVNRLLARGYRPLLESALRHPLGVLCLAGLIAASMAAPLMRLESEFMPTLDEGDLLYMPTTLPSVSLDEAAAILQTTDRLIREMPEVESVHGKAGRSDSAADPAPLSMLETTIHLKPRSAWPAPLSTQELIRRLDERVRLAGLTNSWGFPIRTRIDMLASGVKAPLALRISGPDPATIQSLSERAEAALRSVKGVRAIFAERITSGRFIDVHLDRARASLFGVAAADVSALVSGPLGGLTVDTLSVGRERYPIVMRFPRDDRGSLESIRRIRLRGAAGNAVQLSQIADVRVVDGPTELKSENARPAGYVLLDLEDGDTGGVLTRAEVALHQAGIQEPAYTFSWVGQYLRLQAASVRLLFMAGATLLCVVLILYAHFRCWRRVAIVASSIPFSMSGALWLLWLLDYRWSFASAVGLLALAGVAAEFCVVMLLYLDQAMGEREGSDLALTAASVRDAVIRGALLRLRPKAMTVTVILGGLLPLMIADGVGTDIMRRIAAPMIGGMITAPLFSLWVVPAIYVLWFAAGDRTTGTATRWLGERRSG